MPLLISACAKRQILIDSFPQNADVYVGGEKKGQTPLRVQVNEFFIPVGFGLYGHTITVTKEGYTPFVQELAKSQWGIDTFPNTIFAKLIKSLNTLPSEKHTTIDVSIQGIDNGVRSTKQEDYREAVLFAKREAIERAGVVIKTKSTVKNLVLEEDFIQSQSDAVLVAGYQIVDVGYGQDGFYHIVLIGKIKVLENTIEK